MIDHITLTVGDGKRAKEFYAAALKPLGYEILMEFEGAAGLGAGGKPDFWIAGADATHKLAPMHLAFHATSRKAVDEFYAAAIAAGAKDNGKPGIRAEYHPTYYAAFVYDADGHNVEAVCHKPE